MRWCEVSSREGWLLQFQRIRSHRVYALRFLCVMLWKNSLHGLQCSALFLTLTCEVHIMSVYSIIRKRAYIHLEEYIVEL